MKKHAKDPDARWEETNHNLSTHWSLQKLKNVTKILNGGIFKIKWQKAANYIKLCLSQEYNYVTHIHTHTCVQLDSELLLTLTMRLVRTCSHSICPVLSAWVIGKAHGEGTWGGGSAGENIWVIFLKADDKVQKKWGKDIFIFRHRVWKRSMAECSLRRTQLHLAPGAFGGILGAPWPGKGFLGSIPGSGRSLGEGNGNPFWYSCLENAMDGETCRL